MLQSYVYAELFPTQYTYSRSKQRAKTTLLCVSCLTQSAHCSSLQSVHNIKRRRTHPLMSSRVYRSILHSLAALEVRHFHIPGTRFFSYFLPEERLPAVRSCLNETSSLCYEAEMRITLRIAYSVSSAYRQPYGTTQTPGEGFQKLTEWSPSSLILWRKDNSNILSQKPPSFLKWFCAVCKTRVI